MNLSKILVFLTATLLLFASSSCNKILDMHPQDKLQDEEIYTSIRNYEQAVLGVYAELQTEYNILIGSIFADEAKLANDNMGVNGYASNLHRWNYASDDDVLLMAWKNAYASIYKINLLLNNSERVQRSGSAEEAKLNHLVAELKALRSFIHFGLHQIYGDFNPGVGNYTVPYVTTVDIHQKPPKLPTAEFYTQAEQDIVEALASGTGQSDLGRFSDDAIHAYAARFYLYQKKYKEAIKHATPLITKYKLAEGAHYATLWQDIRNTEVILAFKRNNNNEIRPNTLWRNYGSGKTLFHPSHKILNYLEQEEGERYALFEEDEEEAPIGKYPGNTYADNLNDVKAFRVSELYLILAEAYFFENRPTESSDMLAALQQARGIDSPTTVASIDNILGERFAELCFEGHRYFDLKRLGRTLERDPEDLALTTDKKQLLPTDPNYRLPIPFKETQINPDLKW
ncbi:RagB/SusD family nutrient uptake outer membrane protein [Sphingobacterium tabacisoli]|uniref:RagB/SusD family nutrient uptake outer membrane protein n=1 Tax=Sphingobacterium tabacisoli TaxID=2044855 RepID=A0ABW5L4G3_9SPHI|nr:RagB/SusD family nutrient uptake outer membrane protein [Sphingobacterium tabacisoli]